MKQNVGKTDAAVRIIAAVLIVVLYFSNVISGTIAAVLFVFAGIFILTAFFGVCPIYSVLGISSCPVKTQKK